MDAHGIALKSSVARRQFGRCLLLGLPLAGAALAARPQVVQAGSANDSWKMEGNSNVDSNDFLGTTTNISLVIKTDNVERMRVTKDGLIGIGTASPSTRLHAISPYGTAIRGDSTTTADAAGVLGRLTAASPFASAAGVKGEVTTVGTSNGYGVFGKHAGGGYGVFGASAGSTGVRGEGEIIGVSGRAFDVSGQGRGVLGESFGIGVVGQGIDSGVGVLGRSGDATGVVGQGGEVGVSGSGSFKGMHGIGGFAGVYGEAHADDGAGVLGTAKFDSNRSHGVRGVANFAAAFAGYFEGKVHVQGALSKASGSFVIDHPLDPEDKYLSHSFVESPEMLNVYNGNATTDASGQATVDLPAYFEALNKDFRYQLTVIGQFAQAIVATKIAANRFTIATDKPNVEVSWQVTGIRKDAWAEAHRVVVEEEKPAGERGSYLHPLEHGQPEARGKDYARQQLQRQQGALPPATVR
jgi:hypothetical protein